MLVTMGNCYTVPIHYLKVKIPFYIYSYDKKDF